MDELEIGKELVGQVDGVLTEMYKDTLSPSLKPLGEIMSFIPRTIRLALSGWEKWLVNGEESIRLTALAIREKLVQIPEEKLVEPEAHIAIPAIQQLCYCQDSSELRDLYANLLTSSMNADKKWQVHPAYVDIIKQLCPDEAKYLKALPALSMANHPLIDVKFAIGSNSKGENYAVSNFTTYNLDLLEYPQKICSYIDNLVRLNLIEIPAYQYIVNQQVYDELENHPMIQNPIAGEQKDIKYSYEHKVFKLTNFGVSFVNTVCH